MLETYPPYIINARQASIAFESQEARGQNEKDFASEQNFKG